MVRAIVINLPPTPPRRPRTSRTPRTYSFRCNRRVLVPQHFSFQPLPTPIGPAPYRFDLSQLLHADAVAAIKNAGKLVFHTVGDTGDERGKQMDFVAALMTEDYDASADNAVPAFFYHLGDVVYFAGDIDAYGENFYETYAEYPGLIVAIAGNHDCQPDDPQDGPVSPHKTPLDGWVQNFMSKDPTRLGSLKTTSARTQMDLPNVYWTFTTPLATIIGLFSNVSETEAELHQDQIDWFKKRAESGRRAQGAYRRHPSSAILRRYRAFRQHCRGTGAVRQLRRHRDISPSHPVGPRAQLSALHGEADRR